MSRAWRTSTAFWGEGVVYRKCPASKPTGKTIKKTPEDPEEVRGGFYFFGLGKAVSFWRRRVRNERDTGRTHARARKLHFLHFSCRRAGLFVSHRRQTKAIHCLERERFATLKQARISTRITLKQACTNTRMPTPLAHTAVSLVDSRHGAIRCRHLADGPGMAMGSSRLGGMQPRATLRGTRHGVRGRTTAGQRRNFTGGSPRASSSSSSSSSEGRRRADGEGGGAGDAYPATSSSSSAPSTTPSVDLRTTGEYRV